MSGRAQTDFHFTIERAAGLCLDATCSARAAGYGRLPAPHRRLIQRAVRSLEAAQDALYEARNNPWAQPPVAAAAAPARVDARAALLSVGLPAPGRAPRLRAIAELIESRAERAGSPARVRAVARAMRVRASELESGNVASGEALALLRDLGGADE